VSTFSNVLKFVTKKLKPYQGMKVLIHRFYDSIRNDTAPPVTRDQALAVLETMDEIWGRLPLKPLDLSPIPARETTFPLKRSEKVLVTGGTGFLGKNVVERLVKEGYPVRVLARKLSNIEPLKALGVEILYGDVADTDSLKEATGGMDVIVHAAAGTSGDKKDCDTATIQGTRNVIEVTRAQGVEKLIYISSCSVYGVADYRDGTLVTEDSTLERFPSRRGEYSSSKQSAEELVTAAVKEHALPAVVLRPGTIYGPGGDVYTPMLGFSGPGAFIVIGNGKFELPFVYIDNLSDAIIKSIESDAAIGEIFNVVDGERLTKRAYMNGLIRKLYPKARVFYFPFRLLYATVYFQEVLCRLLGRGAFLTRYRLISSQRSIRYDNSKLKKVLGWTPKTTFSEAVPAIIEYEKKR
jgi:nucleoside-diphosphate-sugar epimerase